MLFFFPVFLFDKNGLMEILCSCSCYTMEEKLCNSGGKSQGLMGI